MDQLISIIMPAYNCEKYVEEAINSVLAQTYQNYELIVIDDGSTDGTVKKIENLRKVDNRIRLYINEKNQGVAETRNKGVSIAKGDWIAFLDSDDCWKEEKLEKQIDFAHKTKGDFIFTGSSFIDENSEPYGGLLEVPEVISYKALLKQNVISCSSVLIKKTYIEKYRMEKDEIHEDFGSWLRILKSEQFAYGLNEPLLIYRISKNSKSGNKLKSLCMAYRTYRYVGLSSIKSTYYICWYVIRGIRKYKRIFT
ncbi:glycosyltransferase family 2 protein [Paenibacillus apii]|uniref:glycosyltransferase family 2 protein n=1 Tax=Paenibacillus apii TaxID=1850370 RepID=UPI0014393E2E|nr:glycosyltransferase family 2 protein [Paenibacillus apii]NJJ41638.1 glycosyltransferase family 2 protein [Paenibacillus apii]